MPVNAIKLGFVGINVVKFDAMVAHYADFIGLPRSAASNDAIWLACGNEFHALSLHRAARSGYRYVGLQVAGEGPLTDVLASLGAEGVHAEIKSDVLPGVKSLVEITDPDGYAIYLYRDSAPAAQRFATVGAILPDKLGHVALFSQNPQAALKFYTENLGFRWSDWLLDIFVFMRCNADHHVLNFLKPPKPREGLFHVAFELRDWAHIGRACDALAIRGIPLVWGPGRHGTGHNLFTYHRDPDGNIVELFADLDRMSNEALGYFDARPYHRDNPQRPKVWGFEEAHLWGPEPPADLWD
jgi:catechol-2,3-dioxygenase